MITNVLAITGLVTLPLGLIVFSVGQWLARPKVTTVAVWLMFACGAAWMACSVTVAAGL